MLEATTAAVSAALQAFRSGPATLRREQWQQLHDLLQDRHQAATAAAARYTHPNACQKWSEGNGAGFMFVPIVRMYAERLSVAFDQAPATYLRRKGSTDRIPEDDAQVVQWRQDERDIKFAATMQQVEETVTALGQVAVSPTWAGKRIRWRVYAPHELLVERGTEDPDSFEGATAIGIELRTVAGGVKTVRWLVWAREGDAWTCALYDEGGRLIDMAPLFQGGLNGYGRHPVVLWQWRQPPNGEVFTEPDEPLLQLARKTNVHFTDLSHGATHQVHAQPVIWGNPLGVQEGGVVTGPDVPVVFAGRRESGDYEFRTPQLNLAELRETINYWLQTFAVTRGLPPDTFLANSSTRNLGAKQQESAELNRLRKRRYPVIMDAMRETFDVHRAVGNYWARNGGGRSAYDDDIELEVELQPIARVEDRQAKAQADELAIARGETSTVQLVQQETGVSHAEAAAAVARNLADEAALRTAPAPGAEPAPVP